MDHQEDINDLQFPAAWPAGFLISDRGYRLEGKALALLRYAHYNYCNGRDEIPFAEIGEIVYGSDITPISTLQNCVRRAAQALAQIPGEPWHIHFAGQYTYISGPSGAKLGPTWRERLINILRKEAA